MDRVMNGDLDPFVKAYLLSRDRSRRKRSSSTSDCQGVGCSGSAQQSPARSLVSGARHRCRCGSSAETRGELSHLDRLSR